MSRRLRLRQHDKRRPIPESPPLDWAAIAADRARREQQPQPKGNES